VALQASIKQSSMTLNPHSINSNMLILRKCPWNKLWRNLGMWYHQAKNLNTWSLTTSPKKFIEARCNWMQRICNKVEVMSETTYFTAFLQPSEIKCYFFFMCSNFYLKKVGLKPRTSPLLCKSTTQLKLCLFFWIMLENLIKQSSRDWPQKKRVQIKGKQNVKVQQRRVKAPLIPITNMETTSAKPWEATYTTWDPHKLRPMMNHKQA